MEVRVVGSPAVRRGQRLTSGFLLFAFLVGALALAALPAAAADFVLNAIVTDIDARPLEGVKVVLGRIDTKDNRTTVRSDATGTTDAQGKATLKLSSSQTTLGAAVVEQPAGRVVAPANGILTLKKGTTEGVFRLIGAPDAVETVPGGSVTTEGFFGDTGRDTYPAPEQRSFTVDDASLKLWKASGPRQGLPVLVVQGFSLASDRVDAYEVYNAWLDLLQGLRQRGRDVWIVTFADVRGPVVGDALIVAKALEIVLDPAHGASRVDVVGQSLGGLAARYALAQDEERSENSAGKVRVFASVDAPHQGMNVHPAVQAALWSLDATAMLSPGLQNMLYTWVGATNFSTDDCRFPEDSSIRATTAAHDAFYRTLNALNGDGYPHRSRNVALAGGGTQPRSQKKGDNVYRLQASLKVLFGSVRLCREDYKARDLDVLPGSVFPGQLLPQRVDQGPIRIDLDSFMDPTMIPTASAIDLRDGASRFERFFLPDLAKGALLRHGDPIPQAADFLLWQLTDVSTTVFDLPAAPASGWFRAKVTVALRASSPYNDVLRTEASLDGGGTWTPYTAPIEIGADGANRILARSVVAAGNVEEPAVEMTVRIDATPPVLTITAPDPREYVQGDTRTITVAATDATSGVAPATLVVKLNGAAVDATQPIALAKLAPGSYTVEAAVEDVAGNRTTASLTFTVKAAAS